LGGSEDRGQGGSVVPMSEDDRLLGTNGVHDRSEVVDPNLEGEEVEIDRPIGTGPSRVCRTAGVARTMICAQQALVRRSFPHELEVRDPVVDPHEIERVFEEDAFLQLPLLTWEQLGS
jgi:hypothetical protein